MKREFLEKILSTFQVATFKQHMKQQYSFKQILFVTILQVSGAASVSRWNIVLSSTMLGGFLSGMMRHLRISVAIQSSRVTLKVLILSKQHIVKWGCTMYIQCTTLYNGKSGIEGLLNLAKNSSSPTPSPARDSTPAEPRLLTFMQEPARVDILY